MRRAQGGAPAPSGRRRAIQARSAADRAAQCRARQRAGAEGAVRGEPAATPRPLHSSLTLGSAPLKRARPGARRPAANASRPVALREAGSDRRAIESPPGPPERSRLRSSRSFSSSSGRPRTTNRRDRRLPAALSSIATVAPSIWASVRRTLVPRQVALADAGGRARAARARRRRPRPWAPRRCRRAPSPRPGARRGCRSGRRRRARGSAGRRGSRRDPRRRAALRRRSRRCPGRAPSAPARARRGARVRAGGAREQQHTGHRHQEDGNRAIPAHPLKLTFCPPTR